jgi:hypothetical protein
MRNTKDIETITMRLLTKLFKMGAKVYDLRNRFTTPLMELLSRDYDLDKMFKFIIKSGCKQGIKRKKA